METIILILAALLIFAILYVRILRKENKLLLDDLSKCEKMIPELKKAICFQKNIAKTFEAGYDNLKSKLN